MIDDETVMVVETPQPRQAHVLWLSSKAPFSSGHKAVITEDDDIKPIFARSMQLGKDYDVQVYNRKKEFVDAFCITYMHDKCTGRNVIIKHLGHYQDRATSITT